MKLIPPNRSLRLACEAADIGTWQWDMAQDQLHYDPVARKICGLPAEGPVPRELARELVHVEERDRVSALSSAALDPVRRERAIYLCRITRASDGAVRRIRATGQARFDRRGPSGRAVHYLGTVQDITDESEAEERLQQSEARLRLAMDAAGLAVWEVDLASGTLTPSPELNRLLGFPANALPTLEDARSRYAPGERDRITAEGDAIRAAGGDRIQTTARFIMPDGSEKHLLIRAQIAPGAAGPNPRVIGVLADVTEARSREERLNLVNRELHHRLLNLITVISAISRKTITDPAESRKLQDRLRAMGEGIRTTLGGNLASADLMDLLTKIAEPFEEAKGRFQIEGPSIRLPAGSAGACALAFHELLTNALKYGALSDPRGAIEVKWQTSGDRAQIQWSETLGRRLSGPRSAGFGSTLITKLLFHPPDTASIEYRESGVLCRLDVTAEH